MESQTTCEHRFRLVRKEFEKVGVIHHKDMNQTEIPCFRLYERYYCEKCLTQERKPIQL